MYLSEEQGLIRLQYLQNKLKTLPVGKITERSSHGKKYEAVYIHYHPKDPSIRRKYFSLSTKHGRSLARLVKESIAVQKEITDIQFRLKSDIRKPRINSPMKRRTEPQKMNRAFFDELKKTEDSNPYEKPADAIEHNGILMRTKGEKILAEHFDFRGLEYAYEPGLWLDSYIYPDFAIYIPEIDKVIFVEFMGAFDKPKYLYRSGEKFKDYMSHGYMLGRDVIMICETGNNRVDMETVDIMINAAIMANTQAA